MGTRRNKDHLSFPIHSISGGELFERVVADDFALTERDCILFVRQICEGVNYMHKNLIVHLDLKVGQVYFCLYLPNITNIKKSNFQLVSLLRPRLRGQLLHECHFSRSLCILLNLHKTAMEESIFTWYRLLHKYIQ